MTRIRLAGILLVAATLTQAAYPSSPDIDNSGASSEAEKLGTVKLRSGYAGDAACARCHNDLAVSYMRTAHHLTSQIATAKTVLGDLHPPNNQIRISDSRHNSWEPFLYFETMMKDGAIEQSAVTGWDDRFFTRHERLSIATGAGVRGQSYLYWQADRLFELPVSYWTEGHQWVNSPGYIDGTADFSRPVNPGCLECHLSYAHPLSTDPLSNSYDKTTIETGISCETCHGPGAEHVAAYSSGSAHPGDSFILNPSKFTRDRQVDACAYCHNGTQRKALTPAFSFIPGRPLSDFFQPLQTVAADHPDVHGNQVALLERSKCYQFSPAFSCSTCHDSHAAEKAPASYSTVCLKCHQWTSCGEAKKIGPRIIKNCIDCHMPVEATNLILSETAGRTLRAKMRNHWIKVYSPSLVPEAQPR